MSEQKMREALEQILAVPPCFVDTTYRVRLIASQALARHPVAGVELTDAEIQKCAEPDWPQGLDPCLSQMIAFAHRVIAAHEAKKAGGGV